MPKKVQAEPVLIDGKPIELYDGWTTLPGGFAVPHPELKRHAGLYRAVENGEVIFVGKGAGWTTGLYERLNDLRRPGDSGRRYHGGRYIHANMDRLVLQVAVIGRDNEARETTAKLLRPMIDLHQPRLNVDPAIVGKLVQDSYGHQSH